MMGPETEDELFRMIERVMRATTNPDVLSICEELKVRLIAAAEKTGDRKAYMRDYMRKRRAKGVQ